MKTITTPPEILGFLMRSDLIKPSEARTIHDSMLIQKPWMRKLSRPWHDIVTEFEQIIGRVI